MTSRDDALFGDGRHYRIIRGAPDDWFDRLTSRYHVQRPNGSLLTTTATLRGARRAIVRDLARNDRPKWWHGTTIERIPGRERSLTPPTPPPSATLSQDPTPGVVHTTPTPDWAARVEEDRYVVLLSCGHWTQTRRPEDATWPCPADGIESPAAWATRDDEGFQVPAVLTSWEVDEPRHERRPPPERTAGGGR